MAREMHSQFLELDDISNYSWDPHTMHIYCFCHKMALIVGAGLAALGLKTPPPRKTKVAMRGHFPDVRTTDIVEEEEEPEASDDVGPVLEVPDVPQPPLLDDFETEPNIQELAEREEDDLEPDIAAFEEDEWDAADAEDAGDPLLVLENEVQPTHRRESNKLNALLTKVGISPFHLSLFSLDLSIYPNRIDLSIIFPKIDFILRRITRSSAWRKEFDRVKKSLGLEVESLIAAYGIRWNIKYISRQRAWLARDVSWIIQSYLHKIRVKAHCFHCFRLSINSSRMTWIGFITRIDALATMESHMVISMK